MSTTTNLVKILNTPAGEIADPGKIIVTKVISVNKVIYHYFFKLKKSAWIERLYSVLGLNGCTQIRD